jgi:HEAT repeat protein
MNEEALIELLRAASDAKALVKLMEEDPRSTSRAADALADLPDPAAAIMPLLAFLERRESFISQRTRQYLNNPDAPRGSSEAYAREAAAADMVGIELRAIRIFRAGGSKQGLEVIVQTTRDSDVRDDARSALTFVIGRPAAKTLGEMREPGAVRAQIEALRDDFWVRRERAAEALGKLGDPQAVEPLILLLDDEDFRVKREAAKALGRLGEARAVEPLIERLSVNKGAHSWRAVVDALAMLGGARAEAALTAVCDDEDGSVRVAAREAISKLEALKELRAQA